MNLESSLSEGMEYPQGLQGKFAAMRDEAEAAYYGKRSPNKPDSDVEGVGDDEYKAECSVLPKGFLEKINVNALVPADFGYLTGGLKCSVAILPFADNCSGRAALEEGERWEDFLANQEYLRLLVVNSAGMGLRFEGDHAGYWHDLLPEVLRKDVTEGGCTFELNYPVKNVANRVDPMDEKSQAGLNRAWVMQKIRRALENLEKFFGPDFGSEPGTKLH